jgi:hypothetical protein
MLSFLRCVLLIVVYHVVLFLVVIILFYGIRYPVSDYSCGIFKKFRSGITFIRYSEMQTFLSKKTKWAKLNKLFRLLNVRGRNTSVLSQ